MDRAGREPQWCVQIQQSARVWVCITQSFGLWGLLSLSSWGPKTTKLSLGMDDGEKD